MAINSNQRKSDSEKELTPEQQAALKEWELTKSLLNAFGIKEKDITDVRQRGDSNSENVYETELQQGEEKRSLYAFYKEDEESRSLIVSTTLDYKDTRFYAYRMYTKRNEVHSVTYGIPGRQWALHSVWPQNANAPSSGEQNLQVVTKKNLINSSLLQNVKDEVEPVLDHVVAPGYQVLERFLEDLTEITENGRESGQQTSTEEIGTEALRTTSPDETTQAEGYIDPPIGRR